MKSKWHNISIRSESFAELLELQRRLPIRASIPQLIEWLIKVGQKNIKQNAAKMKKLNRTQIIKMLFVENLKWTNMPKYSLLKLKILT